MNVRDNEGSTPLYYAAELARFKNVEFLLSNGADPNIENNHGNIPLWAAIYSSRGESAIVKSLLNKGSNYINKIFMVHLAWILPSKLVINR